MRARDLEGFGPVGTNGPAPQTLSARLDAMASMTGPETFSDGYGDTVEAITTTRECYALLREAAELARRVEAAEVCTVPPDSFTTAVLSNHAREPLRVALVPLTTPDDRGATA